MQNFSYNLGKALISKWKWEKKYSCIISHNSDVPTLYRTQVNIIVMQMILALLPGEKKISLKSD